MYPMSFRRPTTPLGSQRRSDAVCSLVSNAPHGSYVVCHQDTCGVFAGRDCTCLPDIWRVEKGRS